MSEGSTILSDVEAGLPLWQARILSLTELRYWWLHLLVLFAWLLGVVSITFNPGLIASTPFVLLGVAVCLGSYPVPCNAFLAKSLRRRPGLALVYWWLSCASLTAMFVLGTLLSLGVVGHNITARSTPFQDFWPYGLFLVLIALSLPWNLNLDVKTLRRLASERIAVETMQAAARQARANER